MKELILNEKELIRRCIRNDRHAQEFLFNQFYKDLYVIGMRYLSDHHDTEDAIILSFTRIFKSLKNFKYKEPGSLGRWVRTILINESIRMLNKKRLIHFDEDIRHFDHQNQEANGLQQMQASDITRMIEQLPTGYRTVFNLFIIEGYSHREIAQMLRISENTSKTQLKKARGHLVNNINEEKTMDPSDIDNLIREKLRESSDLHNHEMDSAKPFIWSAIQNKTVSKRMPVWYHLAAAIVLLAISFSLMFFNSQKVHNRELTLLSDKIDQLQVKYLSGEELLRSKNDQVESLGKEILQIELKVADLKRSKSLPREETIVYLTDTVYIKQVEYLTISEPIQEKEKSGLVRGEQHGQAAIAPVQHIEMDEAIFPSYSNQTEDQQSGFIKLKFGSFASNSN